MPMPVLTEHVAYEYVQTIDARPTEVFPLLCPEREKEWIPTWTSRMIHSKSGVAEPGAVFATPEGKSETLWYTVAHDPASGHVRFVRWQPSGMIVDIDIHVSSRGSEQSNVRIVYRFTATNEDGRQAVKAVTPAYWNNMMINWQNLMNSWLKEQKPSSMS